MYVLVAVMLLVSTVACQRIEDGWKEIQPLKTSKATVQKILGKPEIIDDNNYHGYRVDGTFIQVNYSTAPCEENQYKRGRYHIPADTVLDYIVNLHVRIKLSDLKFDPGKYYKELDHHVSDLVHYTKRGNSIRISAVVENETEYAGRISFRASESTTAKVQCTGSSKN